MLYKRFGGESMKGFWNDIDGLNLPETLAIVTVGASIVFYAVKGSIDPNWTYITGACLGVGGLQRIGEAGARAYVKRGEAGKKNG